MSSTTANATAGGVTQQTASNKGDIRLDNSKTRDVRASNIIAAKAVADAVRTSLGPRGMNTLGLIDYERRDDLKILI